MGLVHIYCGNGKGKTTASIGLAIRCAGSDGKVLFCQFMKNNNSGEINILKLIENISIYENYKMPKFSFKMSMSELNETAEQYKKQLLKIYEIAKENCYDMIVLDEIMTCISCNLIKEEDLINFISSSHNQTEIILTGRCSECKIYEYADYISDIKKIKHPYDKGVKARKGIEY